MYQIEQQTCTQVSSHTAQDEKKESVKIGLPLFAE